MFLGFSHINLFDISMKTSLSYRTFILHSHRYPNQWMRCLLIILIIHSVLLADNYPLSWIGWKNFQHISFFQIPEFFVRFCLVCQDQIFSNVHDYYYFLKVKMLKNSWFECLIHKSYSNNYKNPKYNYKYTVCPYIYFFQFIKGKIFWNIVSTKKKIAFSWNFKIRLY